MCDVRRGHEEGHDNVAYASRKLQHTKRQSKTHCACVTHLAAKAMRRLEGTQNVTISCFIVIPAAYKLLLNLEKDDLRRHWDDTIVQMGSSCYNVKEA